MSIVYEGILTNKNEAYHVRVLTLEDIDDILDLQQIIERNLTDEGTLQPLLVEEFEYILRGKGLMIGAFLKEELIAFRALMEPPIDEEHLGYDVRLAKDEFAKVIYQEISIVHPDYRGNRLQQKLATLIMEELDKQDHHYKYICCTVSPFNIPSLKDKFNQKMHVYRLKEVYGDKLRYVFMKRIVPDEVVQWKETKSIFMKDIAAQQNLLDSGWIGYEMYLKDDEQMIRFGK